MAQLEHWVRGCMEEPESNDMLRSAHPGCSSAPTPTPTLARASQEQRKRSWGIGCVMVLEVMDGKESNRRGDT